METIHTDALVKSIMMPIMSDSLKPYLKLEIL